MKVFRDYSETDPDKYDKGYYEITESEMQLLIEIITATVLKTIEIQ